MIKVSDTIKIPGLDKKREESLLNLSKNKYVKEFLKSNHLNDQYLSDYWIEFLDYSEDKKRCEGCLGLNECPKENKGMIDNLTMINNEVSLEMTSCRYYLASQNLINHFVVRNIKEDLLLTDLETLIKENKISNKNALVEVMKYIKEPNDIGLFIHGEGIYNEKTILMAALMNALAKKGYNVGFVHFPTYLVDLKASFNSNESMNWTDLMEVPYLVLDGIGEENVTPYSRDEVLLTILSYRAINNLPTFFTSFYGFKDLAKVYTIKKGDEIKAKTVILKMKALSKEIILD
jgi:DNA replication protein DnaC